EGGAGEGGGRRLGGPPAARHHRGAEPAARPRGGSARTEGRERRPADEDPLRLADRDRATHVRGLRQPARGPPLLLQALPGEQDPRRVRLRRDADRPQGARASPFTAGPLTGALPFFLFIPPTPPYNPLNSRCK